MDKKLHIFNVYKDEILKGSYKRTKECLRLLKSKKAAARNTLIILFDGYNEVTDEIYQIKPIRMWTKKLVNEHPEIFCFLSNFMDNNQIFLSTLCDLNTVMYGDATKSPMDYHRMGVHPSDFPKVTMEIIVSHDLIQKITRAMLAYGAEINDIEGALEALKIFDRYL